MQVLKAIASFFALALVVVGIAQVTGVVPIPDTDADLILTLSGFLGILGVTRLTLSPKTAKLLTGIASVIVAAGVAHAGGHLAVLHPKVMHAIGIIGTLLGIAGATPTLVAPPVPPVTPEPGAVPKAA